MDDDPNPTVRELRNKIIKKLLHSIDSEQNKEMLVKEFEKYCDKPKGIKAWNQVSVMSNGIIPNSRQMRSALTR